LANATASLGNDPASLGNDPASLANATASLGNDPASLGSEAPSMASEPAPARSAYSSSPLAASAPSTPSCEAASLAFAPRLALGAAGLALSFAPLAAPASRATSRGKLHRGGVEPRRWSGEGRAVVLASVASCAPAPLMTSGSLSRIHLDGKRYTVPCIRRIHVREYQSMQLDIADLAPIVARPGLQRASIISVEEAYLHASGKAPLPACSSSRAA
jgi:hypothetical protein